MLVLPLTVFTIEKQDDIDYAMILLKQKYKTI